MIKFIPASELKAKYNIFGHFYTVRLPGDQTIECRSVLELAAKSLSGLKSGELAVRKPDAVFIMMNPGSSKPLSEVNNRIHLSDIHKLVISLVETRPDTTQYQLMRVMHYLDWQHVRVLNLSDLRCAQSNQFYKLFAELEDAGQDCHTVFAASRQNELAVKMPKSKTMPVALAWGVSPKLDPLIQRCLTRLGKGRKVLGLMKEETTDKYYHPLPTLQSQKLRWVEDMVKSCRG